MAKRWENFLGRNNLSSSNAKFNKACDPDDWNNPDLRSIMKNILLLPHDPDTQKSRKNWEWAMGYKALKDYGYLTPEKRAIGIGAGHERLIYVLSNHLQLVLATDLYGKTKFSRGEASPSMMSSPEIFFDSPFRKDHLLIASMDGCDLTFGDNSFDILFSFSSLEHFGSDERIRQCMKNAYRIMKPGGIFVLAVDYIYHANIKLPRILRPWKAGEFFTEHEVKKLVLDVAPFRLKEEINFRVDRTKEENIFNTITKKYPGPDIHPHIYLKFFGWYFTSLMLVLFKD